MKYTFAIISLLLVFLGNPEYTNAQFPDLAGIYSLDDYTNDCGATYNRLVINTTRSAARISFYVYVRVTDSLNNLIATGRHPDDGPWQMFINPANHDFLTNQMIPIPGYSMPQSRPWVWNVIVSSRELTFTEIKQNEPTYITVFDPVDYTESCSFLPVIPYVLPTSTMSTTPLVNTGNSENEVAVYNATDDNGEPALHIYDINNEGNGTLALEITQDIIAPYIDNPPAENTEIASSENGKVTLYVLDTGELQINSGPDEEGKTHVLIFDGIPPTNIYGYVIDPPLFP